MEDMIKIYLKDLTRGLRNKILKWDNVSVRVKRNEEPVAIILPEDVSNWLDWEEDWEPYEDEFNDYNRYVDDYDEEYSDDFDEEYDWERFDDSEYKDPIRY